MKRIMIIGCSGAGKSTLSRKLHSITQIELIHLDRHYWKPDWVETTKGEWKAMVQAMTEKPAWIIDGNYGGTMDIRIKAADTIIFLNFPTLICLWRVWKRTLLYWNTHRPDITKGCNERIDWGFYHYVANYNRTRRPGILEKLEKVSGEKEIVILRSNRAIELYLKQVQSMGNF